MVVEPGVPALPKQVVDVTPGVLVCPTCCCAASASSEAPTRTAGPLLPLTGAPAIEGSTANTTFDSPTFWPQQLATPNYFGALGDSGRTSLILTPAQYRNFPGTNPQQPTNTERAYSHLDFRLFYSSPQSEKFGGVNGNQPALAAAPAISDVQGTPRHRQPDPLPGARHRRPVGRRAAGLGAFTEGPNASGNGNWEPEKT